MEERTSWVGRSWTARQVLDPSQCRRMQATLDRPPSLREGDPVPPGWHWLYFPDVVRAGDLGEEGHPRLGICMPPVPLPRRMWAGGRLEFRAPAVLGRPAERRTVIRSITPKNGRSGPLCFVTVEHELIQDDRVCLAEQQTIVYRDLPTPPAPPAPPAPTEATGAAEARSGPPGGASAEGPGDPTTSVRADFADTWDLDSVALFRYSALTFNGHRIHYDVDYCRTVEGYPGLVVHGPLLATLLLDLAERHGRGPGGLSEPGGQGQPGVFTYRARSPLFLPGAFTVNGRADGAATELWVTGHHGGLAMQARSQ